MTHSGRSQQNADGPGLASQGTSAGDASPTGDTSGPGPSVPDIGSHPEDKVVDLMAALEASVNEAKAARRKREQAHSGSNVEECK